MRLGGGTISDSILGGTRHFFLLNLYNFKNIGGVTCPSPLPPYSAVPAQGLSKNSISGRRKRRKLHAIVAEVKYHGNMSVN